MEHTIKDTLEISISFKTDPTLEDNIASLAARYPV